MTKEKQLKTIALSLLQMIEDKICWYKCPDDLVYLADLKRLIEGRKP